MALYGQCMKSITLCFVLAFFGIMKRRIEDVVLNRVDKVNFCSRFPTLEFLSSLPPHIFAKDFICL